ncbi:hypothetical protein ABK040_005149 [Willaertia magna]
MMKEEIQNNWIYKWMKVKVSDERILIGKFICVDDKCNIILRETTEYRPRPYDQEYDERKIGLVMVPGNHITNVCISTK